METLLAILLGLGLAAACGFRGFVPMFFVGLAYRTGHMELASGFEWLGSTPALICLGSAMLLEALAYFIPWLDNLLDSIATPAAVIAGTILSMGMVSDMSPLLHWALGIVGGGSSAATVQVATVLLRGGSPLTTGGAANPALAAGEIAASGAMVALAIFIPILAGLAGLALLVGMFFLIRKLLRHKKKLIPA